MNIYFLVEGRRTEAKVYPKWLEHLRPELKRVHHHDQITQNNYFLISGGGYPSIYHHLKNAVHDINDTPGYDYLTLCLDADESSPTQRINQINHFMNDENLKLNNCRFKIIVQNKCLETWFMGNNVVYPRHPNNEPFISYAKHYNVSTHDPEKMETYPGFTSVSLFHYAYLKEMLAERNIIYSKIAPRGVTEPNYLEQLISRVQTTPHLNTLKDFLNFCKSIET